MLQASRKAQRKAESTVEGLDVPSPCPQKTTEHRPREFENFKGLFWSLGFGSRAYRLYGFRVLGVFRVDFLVCRLFAGNFPGLGLGYRCFGLLAFNLNLPIIQDSVCSSHVSEMRA